MGPLEEMTQAVDAVEAEAARDGHETGFNEVVLIVVEYDAGFGADVALQEAVVVGVDLRC
jgi:hypothetical protein